MGPVSLPPHSGPWELLAVPSGYAGCQQRQADKVKASGMSGSLSQQLMSCEYLISSGFQALFSGERGWDLGGILKRR